MFQVKLIKHQNTTAQDIKEIIDLKSKQWDFSLDSQLQWIKKNIKNSDFHMLLMLDNKNVAYLNLIDIDLIVNGISKKGLGVGNVCAIEKGKGYGFELMKEANRTISNLNKIGLLFCKESLLKFYSSLAWKELKQGQYRINCEDSNVIVLNIDICEGIVIDYEGVLF